MSVNVEHSFNDFANCVKMSTADIHDFADWINTLPRGVVLDVFLENFVKPNLIGSKNVYWNLAKHSIGDDFKFAIQMLIINFKACNACLDEIEKRQLYQTTKFWEYVKEYGFLIACGLIIIYSMVEQAEESYTEEFDEEFNENYSLEEKLLKQNRIIF